jgi:hypothetical protein
MKKQIIIIQILAVIIYSNICLAALFPEPDILVAAQGFSASRNDMLPSGGGCAVALLRSRTAGAEPRQ